MRAHALALLALAGCSKILGLGDVSRGDGGSSITPDAPPNTVVGRNFYHYITATGTEDAPLDLSTTTVQALLPDSGQASGYSVVQGTGMADGTFSVSPVPDNQPYMLRIGNGFYALTSHSVEIRYDTPARPETNAATLETDVSYNIANMQPAQAGDGYEIDAWSLAYSDFLPDSTQGSAYVAVQDWKNGSNFVNGIPVLPDPSKGDELVISHSRQQTITNAHDHEVTTILDAAIVPAPAMTNGSPASVTGTFMTAPPTSQLTSTVSRGGYDVGFDSMSQFLGITVSLLAHPIFNDFGIGSPVVSIDYSDWSGSTQGTDTVDLMYGDPFPTSWARIAATTYTRYRRYKLPGTAARTIAMYYSRLAQFQNNTLSSTPTLIAPQGFKIEGKDAAGGGLVHFDGTSPVHVTWTGQTAAKQYELAIYRVYASGGQATSQLVAGMTTMDTSMTVPAEVFGGDAYFRFTVTAYATPNDYASGQVIPNGAPNQIALSASNLFRLSSTCGNGTPDAGEECDAAGESATCDVDCTANECGDGIRNAAAGEACDTIADTPGCDNDCTLPVCGDGHLNRQVEDCDDHNNMNGDGCSSTCRVEP
jgi:cysteine-rich repeat protein